MRRRDLQDGCLGLIEDIVKKRFRSLGIFEMHRLVRALVLVETDHEQEQRVYHLLFRLMLVDDKKVFNALQRLQLSEDGSVRERASAAFRGMMTV